MVQHIYVQQNKHNIQYNYNTDFHLIAVIADLQLQCVIPFCNGTPNQTLGEPVIIGGVWRSWGHTPKCTAVGCGHRKWTHGTQKSNHGTYSRPISLRRLPGSIVDQPIWVSLNFWLAKAKGRFTLCSSSCPRVAPTAFPLASVCI